MIKTAPMVATIGTSTITHAIRGEYSYVRNDNRTMCGRRGVFGVIQMQSGKELPVTCNACQASGPRWIVYLYVNSPAGSWDVVQAKNLREAVSALETWSEQMGTDDVSASLYPFTPDDWQSAMNFRDTGCPFDYPTKVIERGPRGGFSVKNA